MCENLFHLIVYIVGLQYHSLSVSASLAYEVLFLGGSVLAQETPELNLIKRLIDLVL